MEITRLTEQNKVNAEYRVDSNHIIQPILLNDGSYFLRTELIDRIKDQDKIDFLTELDVEEISIEALKALQVIEQ